MDGRWDCGVWVGWSCGGWLWGGEYTQTIKQIKRHTDSLTHSLPVSLSVSTKPPPSFPIHAPIPLTPHNAPPHHSSPPNQHSIHARTHPNPLTPQNTYSIHARTHAPESLGLGLAHRRPQLLGGKRPPHGLGVVGVLERPRAGVAPQEGPALFGEGVFFYFFFFFSGGV